MSLRLRREGIGGACAEARQVCSPGIRDHHQRCPACLRRADYRVDGSWSVMPGLAAFGTDARSQVNSRPHAM